VVLLVVEGVAVGGSNRVAEVDSMPEELVVRRLLIELEVVEVDSKEDTGRQEVASPDHPLPFAVVVVDSRDSHHKDTPVVAAQLARPRLLLVLGEEAVEEDSTDTPQEEEDTPPAPALDHPHLHLDLHLDLGAEEDSKGIPVAEVVDSRDSHQQHLEEEEVRTVAVRTVVALVLVLAPRPIREEDVE
jgi:hypothetical protein